MPIGGSPDLGDESAAQWADRNLGELLPELWVDDQGIPSIQPRAVNSIDALADPAFLAAMTTAECGSPATSAGSGRISRSRPS